MTVDRIEKGAELLLVLHGQVDTATAPILEKEITDLSAYTRLTLDFDDVPYVSSAGLRVLLIARKAIQAKENIVLKRLNVDVMEILEMTGFDEIMTVIPS